jgi:hypothetical protein
LFFHGGVFIALLFNCSIVVACGVRHAGVWVLGGVCDAWRLALCILFYHNLIIFFTTIWLSINIRMK